MIVTLLWVATIGGGHCNNSTARSKNALCRGKSLLTISVAIAPLRSSKYKHNLKVRLSYSSLGNQVVAGDFPYLATYGINSKYSAILGGSRPVAITAPGLVSSNFTWETVCQFNVGVDATLLNNRLNFSFDWYRRDTRDMLTSGEVKPAVLGASVPRENAANLKTTGWELSVEWNDKLDNGLSYHVKGVLSDYQSTITKYNNPTGLISQYYVDRKIGEIWGYVSNGLFQSDEEVANHADQSYLYGGKWGTGDVKYEDLTDAKRVWSATDRRWLYPIPTNELTLNNNLTQNPGWEQ